MKAPAKKFDWQNLIGKLIVLPVLSMFYALAALFYLGGLSAMVF